MKSTMPVFFTLAVLAGCASMNVTQQTPMGSQGLARPNQIWVYDFIADPAKIPADSSISAGLRAPSSPPSAEGLETGRQLGAAIATWSPISRRWVFPPWRPDRGQHRKLVMA